MDDRSLIMRSHIIHNIVLAIIALVCGVFFSAQVGNIYEWLPSTNLSGALIGDSTFWGPIVGLPLAIIFFLSLLYTAFGHGKWKKWLYWSLVVPVLFELIFDLSHIYFPILLGLLGYGLGYGVRLVLKKLQK
jgi:hypothetical protein